MERLVKPLTSFINNFHFENQQHKQAKPSFEVQPDTYSLMVPCGKNDEMTM